MSTFELTPLRNRVRASSVRKTIVSMGSGREDCRMCGDVPIWRGWNEYYTYWNEFVKGWFDCKERAEEEGMAIEDASCILPIDSLTSSLTSFFSKGFSANAGELDRKEIPEPYLGNPESAKMVVVQMNPGASEDSKNVSSLNLEATKYYSNRHFPGTRGFLIRDFADDSTCNKLYSKWVERWSATKDVYPPMKDVDGYPNGVLPSMVCGHDGFWWQEARMRWIRNFSGADIKSVFCIELCPFHSRKFSKGSKMAQAMGRRHIIERVLLPAAIAAMKSEVNYVISCGSAMDDFLSSMGAQSVEVWGRGVCRSGDVIKEIPGWPRRSDGRKKANWFKLYIFDFDYYDQESKEQKHLKIPILSMYANCMRMPADDFRVVEETVIKPRMREVGAKFPIVNEAEKQLPVSSNMSGLESTSGFELKELKPKCKAKSRRKCRDLLAE